ncbi:MAG: DNA repair exonuclease [Spirochaetes bacterium]|nr:DNA repair exonuclease [Spirochaetota bacterium]
MFSFLLFSDLHLGATEYGPSDDENRFETLKKIIRIGMEHDLILIAGDLFHGKPSPENFSKVEKIFSDCEKNGKKILIAPGEHEIGDDNKPYAELFNLPACVVFSNSIKGNEFFFDKDGEQICIVGVPSSSPRLFPIIDKINKKHFVIGLFHGEVNLDQQECSPNTIIFTKNDIIKSGIDFFALGHVHQFKAFKHKNQIIGVYAGSPEPFTFQEKGDRFAVSVIVQNNHVSNLKRIAVNSIVAEECVFSCIDFDSMQKLFEAIESRASKRKSLRVILQGTRHFLIDTESIEKLQNSFFRFVWEDLSEPSLEMLIAQFRGYKCFRGDFFNRLSEELKEGKIPMGIEKEDIARLLWSLMREHCTRAGDGQC